MYEDQNNNYVYYQTQPTEQPAAPIQNQGKKKGKAGRFFKKLFACAGLGLCFGLCAAAGFYVVQESTGMFKQAKTAVVSTAEDSQVIQELKDWVNDQLKKNITSSGVLNTNSGMYTAVDATDVVEEVMPAMVSILNKYTERITYFGQPIEQEGEASGSGIIVGENDTELLIATNYHVIENAKQLTVHFIDDSDVKAVVKGSDPDMDLAVIAVKLSDMDEDTLDAIRIAKLGDSDSLKLGESVIAIGNALGYGLSVTGGYVSALDREVEMDDGSKGTFIQTDAAINPGNSGGALINMQGEVIGINSNKIGGTIIEGIGYAIPISAAEPILSDLMSYETREKVEDSQVGYLGIIPQTVTTDAAELYGMPEGVYISQVEEGTPAAEAGLLKGDIIKKIDTRKVSTAEELREQLKYYEAGETIEITVMRSVEGEYEERTVSVTLGERPQN